MIIQLVKNKIIEGHNEKYIEAAKQFTTNLLEQTNCENAYVCLSSEGNEFVTIVTHFRTEEDMNHKKVKSVFLENKKNMKPHFLGNETIILRGV